MRVVRPWLGHEVAVEHRLSHLLIGVVELGFLASLNPKPTHSSLVEHLLGLLAYIRQHLMDSGVICGLEHDAGLCCVHLIDAEWPG
jgi:hypothetical protein